MTAQQAETLLQDYAARGVFRGLSRIPAGAGQLRFNLLWHRDRAFELILNPRAGTARMPVVLPEVPAKSPMDLELREYVRARQSDDRPEHRRIDPAKASLRYTNRAGNAGITLTALDGDLEYCVRKLIALVQEIYLGFLYDGRYYDYMLRVFDLDPDQSR